jgi:hypothetical protein
LEVKDMSTFAQLCEGHHDSFVVVLNGKKHQLTLFASSPAQAIKSLDWVVGNPYDPSKVLAAADEAAPPMSERGPAHLREDHQRDRAHLA